VYWRRRLVVLGGVLLIVLTVALSCSGRGGDDRRATSTGNGGGVAVSTVPADVTPETDDTSFAPSAPIVEPGRPPGNNVPADQSLPTPNPGAAAGACADAEMALTPVPATTMTKAGSRIDIHFKIKNVGTRDCLRDVGADMQEIYIKQGAVKIWSSDACGLAHGNSLRAFAPGAERDFEVLWNGHQATRCSGGEAIGPFPPPGQYEIFGRLGAAVSAPVGLTLTA
jgi:hypothetical protein